MLEARRCSTPQLALNTVQRELRKVQRRFSLGTAICNPKSLETVIMKKKRSLALATLSVIAGTASAQTSVTLFGTVDLNTRYIKSDGQPRNFTQASSGTSSGEIGFRGEEALGGGLFAGFLLVGDLSTDTGVVGDAFRGKFFNRQSLLRLRGNWGEIRAGRDYTPTWWNHALFDPFFNLGIGGLLNVHQMYGGTRMDNSLGYILPANLGGVYGEVKVAAGERGATFDRPGRYYGARIGWSGGPINVAAAVSSQKFAVAFSGVPSTFVNGVPQAIAQGATQKTYNVAASYDAGVAKILAFYDRETVDARKENLYSLGAVVPTGTGEIRLAYNRSKLNNSGTGLSTTVDQVALGYVHNLSKRTALYTTVARLDNKDATRGTLPGSAGPATVGGKSQGAEFGIRHRF